MLGMETLPADLIQMGIGHPVRVSFFDTRFQECLIRLHGGLQSAAPDRYLAITYFGARPSVPAGTRAVVEVLLGREMLFLFTTVRDLIPCGDLVLEWPYEVRTEQKRRHPRIDVAMEMNFLTAKGDPHRGSIENLSAGGLAFLSPVALEVGKEITLAFGVGSGCYFQHVRAKVLRCHPSVRDGFRCGIQFVDLEPEMERHITRWVVHQRKCDEGMEEFTEHH